MPSPVTASFVHDVEEAYLAKILSDLGVGSTVYPEPDWLWVLKAGRTAGLPIMEVEEDKQPAVWMVYLGGGSTRGEIGSRYGGLASEFWDLFSFIRLTPERMGVSSDDPESFEEYATAAADILSRRLRLLFLTYDPSVTCDLIGHQTNGQNIIRWAYTVKRQSKLEMDFYSTLRLEQFVES